MTYYIIIETDNGLVAVDCQNGEDPTVAAERNRGLLVDEGPFDTFEIAMDALGELEPDEEER